MISRAEAIELAAAAMWTPDVSPAAEIVTFQHAEADDRSFLLGLATEALDALLAAGVTFGDDLRVPGWRATFDAQGEVTLHREQPHCEGDEATDPCPSVFVHRPQGEPK